MIETAISLRQPWAAFMVRGIKRIENRRWKTSRRGWVLVHASKGWNRGEAEDDFELAQRIMTHAGMGRPDFGLDEVRSARGGITGAFRIVDCVDESDDPYFFGPYGFVVDRSVRLPTIVPCKGSLGFFSVPRDVAQVCHELLGDLA